METVTVTFEVYADGVQHSTVTGTRDAIERMVSSLKSDDTFCIRTESGTYCQCREWGLLAPLEA